ncbi:MAG: glycosyltransferase, partial [Chloroflexota bacterium]
RGLERVGLELGDPMPRVTAREIVRVLVGERIDLVHGHSLWSALAHMAIKLGRDNGIPGVLTNHSLIERAGLLFFRAIDEVVGWSSWPAVLTGVSRAAARDLSLASGRDARVIPNGLDTTAWAYARAGRAADPTHRGADPAKRIVSVMRLNARKSPQALLDAFAQVHATLDRDVRLDIYGDGTLRPALERHTRELALSHAVTFHGACGPAEVAHGLAAADVFALSGTREAFGIAAAEALAAGVPVVGMRGSGMADVFADGVGGLFADSTGELATLIARILMDDALRMELAANAPAQAARFDWSRVAPAYLAAYGDARHA